MRRTVRSVVAAAALAVVVAGCSIEAPTGAPDAGTASQQPDVATPVPTPNATAVALDAVFGRWRRAPAHPPPDVAQAAEAACRDQAAVGKLPLMVVDARGEGDVTIVFADARAAAVCNATVTDGARATADARPVAGYPAAAPASQKLGLHDLRVVESTTGARSVLVGQVGPDVARVSAQFQDATWSHASMAGGWYAMWWPGRDPALTVAAVDRRSIAVDGFSP